MKALKENDGAVNAANKDLDNQTPELIEIQQLEDIETISTHTKIRRGIATRAAIKHLYDKGVTEINELCKVLNLKNAHVSKIVKELKDANLRDPQFTSLASNALQHQLSENNMEAVKLVYKHTDPAQTTPKQSNQRTNISISFGELSNPNGSSIISGKVIDHKQDTIIDATIVEE